MVGLSWPKQINNQVLRICDGCSLRSLAVISKKCICLICERSIQIISYLCLLYFCCLASCCGSVTLRLWNIRLSAVTDMAHAESVSFNMTIRATQIVLRIQSSAIEMEIEQFQVCELISDFCCAWTRWNEALRIEMKALSTSKFQTAQSGLCFHPFKLRLFMCCC